MLKIAAVTEGAGPQDVVSPFYAEGKYLQIWDADTETLLEACSLEGVAETAYAHTIVSEDCEAVLCGPIEEAPFVILADEGCVSRYEAGGLPAAEALHKMNCYLLENIRDFIGGTGCHSHEGECTGEHDHGDED